SDSARYVYLRDEDTGESWNTGCGPMNVPVEEYCCAHTIARTVISSGKNGIRSSWRIFVPTDLYGEIWTLRVKNDSAQARTVSVFSAVSFSLDGFSHPRYYEMYRSVETAFDPELGGIYCRSTHPFAPHRRYNGYFASSEPATAWDGDLTAFCGPLSTVTNRDASSSAIYQRPRVVADGMNCTDSEGALFIPGAVLQHKLDLAPGEEKVIHFLFGVAEDPMEAQNNARIRLTADAVDEAYRNSEAHYAEKYAGLSIQTPDEKINRIMNQWLKKQVDFCIVGKKGIRDNLQIAVALLSYRPEKAKEEILECLRHQFRDGHAVLTWYPYDDTRYSDQPFWIIWAVCRLVRETGDKSILDLKISWQDGGEATVLEHVKAAIHCLMADKGMNGLVRIYYADWNDALNIPEQEQAESVMLSEQFCLALHEFRDMMLWMERPDDADFAKNIEEEMKQAINRAAWDGEWYMRAMARTENIGTCASTGSKIYQNPQTWAVLADVPDKEKLPKVLKAMDSMERDFGFPLNDPPYMGFDPMVGR
ncbi:MAG: cellobiose phosphorylase, partial [Clostridia bacterium]|nr:cellobiose phosphorylase [Clostridia bacterium]